MTNREKFLEFVVQLSFSVLLCLAVLFALGLNREQITTLLTTGNLPAQLVQPDASEGLKENEPAEVVEKESAEVASEAGDKTEQALKEAGSVSEAGLTTNSEASEKADFSELFD